MQFGVADKVLCVMSIILWGLNLFLFLVPKCFDAVLHPKYRPGLTSGYSSHTLADAGGLLIGSGALKHFLR